MITLKVVVAGSVAGVLANVTGYLVTGRLFHQFQGKTPGTWRIAESWTHYQYAAAVRIGACIAIAILYAAVGNVIPSIADSTLARGAGFGLMVWTATVLPLVVEVSIFVNWHRGFVCGLLLDWLIVCILAATSSAVVLRAV